MNDASHNHGEQENTVSTYSVDVETLQQIALKGDAQAMLFSDRRTSLYHPAI